MCEPERLESFGCMYSEYRRPAAAGFSQSPAKTVRHSLSERRVGRRRVVAVRPQRSAFVFHLDQDDGMPAAIIVAKMPHQRGEGRLVRVQVGPGKDREDGHHLTV